MPTPNSQASAPGAEEIRSGIGGTGFRASLSLRATTHSTPAPHTPTPQAAAAAPHPAAAAPHPAAAAHAPAPATRPAPATAPHVEPIAAPPARGGAAVTLVTAAQLRAIMKHLPSAKAERYLVPLNQAMGEFQINVRLRKAAFLAQVAHESGELAWFQEFASGIAYDLSRNPRKARELGNTHPGDGPRYKGRGPIQLTGRSNYRACGKALGVDLEGNPDIAIEPRIAFRSAGWFWSTHNLNVLADQQNFRQITRRINGGYTHYAERLKYYELALHVFASTTHA